MARMIHQMLEQKSTRHVLNIVVTNTARLLLAPILYLLLPIHDAMPQVRLQNGPGDRYIPREYQLKLTCLDISTDYLGHNYFIIECFERTNAESILHPSQRAKYLCEIAMVSAASTFNELRDAIEKLIEDGIELDKESEICIYSRSIINFTKIILNIDVKESIDELISDTKMLTLTVPDDHRYRTLHGVSLWADGLPIAAVDELTQAVKVDPGDVWANFFLALAYGEIAFVLQRGDFEQMKALIDNALNAYKDSPNRLVWTVINRRMKEWENEDFASEFDSENAINLIERTIERLLEKYSYVFLRDYDYKEPAR